MASTKKARKSKGAQELAGNPDPKAQLDSAALLAASKPVLARLEEDLFARVKSSPAVTAALEARHAAEKQASRTAETFAGWTAALATQVAAAWLLSCVFVRTLEDRGLLKQTRIAGPGAEDSQREFFQLAPSLTERDYLLTVFRELAHHPAAASLFDARHSLVWKLSPSAEATKELLALFRTPNSREPAFRFGQPSTRFLGDLYQDLAEDVRKRYALLQTPDFIEEFILDRTLEPAITRFGLDDTTLIDPTCGSGHFLLGAFDRLFEHRLRAEPGIDPRQAARKALDAVYGADINPYAVAIARFRLTLSYLDKAGYKRLADAPTLPLHLVVADSLRINPQHPQQELWQQAGVSSDGWLGDVFTLEDEQAARDVLFRQYAAVVGNPPYITVKDSAMRELYRSMYTAAAGKYALSAPFCERFFQLARPRGYTGQITANSFMKREFGKQLVETVLPLTNLTLIVNASGAYIPGHGTPTVILFGTNEVPEGSSVQAVLAKRGEPATPEVASEGLVWRSIVTSLAQPQFEDDYISTAFVERLRLAAHPWSLGGGGVGDLKDLLEECSHRLTDCVTSIGFMAITGEDDVFVRPRRAWARCNIEQEWISEFGIGEEIRDWGHTPNLAAAFPYRKDGLHPPTAYPRMARMLWPFRRTLLNRPDFGGKKYIDVGRTWYEYHQVPVARLRSTMGIAFAFVATHNHFIYTNGGTVFNRTAPVIKLAEGASEDEHLALLAYLNSSIACLWMKQMLQNRGAEESVVASESNGVVRFTVQRAGTGSGGGYEFAGTLLGQLPIPQMNRSQRDQAIALARAAIRGSERMRRSFDNDSIDEVMAAWVSARKAIVACQEEMDWLCYQVCGLVDLEISEDPVPLAPGERPFEVALARQYPNARTVIGTEGYELSPRDPDGYDEKALEILRRRLHLIETNAHIRLLEREEFKRRWMVEDVEGQHRASQSERALYRAENSYSTVEIGRVEPTCQPHVEADSVPFVAAARYSVSGLECWNAWLDTWELQRREDSGVRVEAAPPPKYRPADFRMPRYFRLRGKLDVPKEGFISYPFCESDTNGEPVYGWAGWDHLQRSQALGALYLNRRDVEGWTAERLTPMLAGLLELIPWIKQWHNEPSEEFGGLRMGDYYAQFLDEECRRHGLTHDDLRAWRPPKKGKAKKAPAKKEKPADGDGVAEAAEEKPKPKRVRKKKAAEETAAGESE